MPPSFVVAFDIDPQLFQPLAWISSYRIMMYLFYYFPPLKNFNLNRAVSIIIYYQAAVLLLASKYAICLCVCLSPIRRSSQAPYMHVYQISSLD